MGPVLGSLPPRPPNPGFDEPGTDQVADVGQILVGENRFSIQVGNVEETAEHRSRHDVTQDWPLLVDVAGVQWGAVITADCELLSSGPCQGRASSLEEPVEGRREVGLLRLWGGFYLLNTGLFPTRNPRKPRLLGETQDLLRK